MIDGFMRLDFDVFRENPFRSASLKFTTGKIIRVVPVMKAKMKSSLEVTFDRETVSLHPNQSGPVKEGDEAKVENFREKFLTARESLIFEFIDTSRIIHQRPPDEENAPAMHMWQEYMRLQAHGVNPKAFLNPEQKLSIADKVLRFINEAQVNHRRFFASSETDLFAQILKKLTGKANSKLEGESLLQRLKAIEQKDKRFRTFGIEIDNWEYKNIEKQMQKASLSPSKDQAVVALGAFVEVLESRTAERSLLADRLETFVRVMSEFFHDKTVSISPRTGLAIKTNPPEKRILKEQQLSTGEYHLLYLMVAALVTQRRGTVLAIDEPEMSMHLAWQRKLIRVLFECASKAEPQFIFATHSPDIAADFPDSLVQLGS
jgi:predicted ATP-dependent endonuclease of OLD family